MTVQYQTRIGIAGHSRTFRTRKPVKLKKKQGTRLLKAYCARKDCGYNVRVTKSWLAVGFPTCGVRGHGRMVCDDFDGEGEE